MLTEEEQNSLKEDSLVNYRGQLWYVYRRLNEDQVVINTVGQSTTVSQRHYWLTMPTDAELLAHRLMGSWRDSDSISAFVLARSIAEEFPRLTFQFPAETVKRDQPNLCEVSAP